MAMNEKYAAVEPTRAEIEALDGPTLLEFGAPWCGFCQAAQPLLASAMRGYPELRHIKVEDGKGKPLGRSYRIKLWPTLVFLNKGSEVERIVRPDEEAEIRTALARIDAIAKG